MSVFVMTEHFISLDSVQTANRQAMHHLPISRFDALALRGSQRGITSRDAGIRYPSRNIGFISSAPDERVNQHKG